MKSTVGRRCRWSVVALVGLIAGISAILPGRVSAQPIEVKGFPLQMVADRGGNGIEFALDQPRLAELQNLREVRLTGLVLPNEGPVDLDLRRVPLQYPKGGITVDGRVDPSTVRDLDLTLWKGTVVGAPASSLFLAFSTHGSRGWIHSEDTYHLTASPDPDHGWESSRSTLFSDDQLLLLGLEGRFECNLDEVAQPRLLEVMESVSAEREVDPSSGQHRLGGGPPLPLYECRIAVETDNQFYDLFGNFAAARNYALTLLSAVSDRYREQIGTILTYPYLAIYSGLSDPWSTQDSGGGAGSLLNEFRNAWDGGSAPVEADLYHFVSGASLGGGVAYLDVICDPTWGFGVSGDMGAQTPLPVIPNHPLNWDFMVIAHELGHNFATPHTHDYCPPIDECAPSGYWGACQTQTQCTGTGTLMSYCHLCSGGLSNVTSFFHPEIIQTMRSGVTSSCLQVFRGIFTENLGNAFAGSNGTPGMTLSFSGSSTLQIDVVNAPLAARGAFIASFEDPIYRPYRGGGVMVPRIDFLRELRSDAGGVVSIEKDVSSFSFPNGDFIYSQMWFIDPTGPNGFSATNGVAFELILP